MPETRITEFITLSVDRRVGISRQYRRLMTDYFSYLLLNKIVLFHKVFKISVCMTANTERYSEFLVRCVSFVNNCPSPSQPMGKTEFSSIAKNRTNSISQARKQCLKSILPYRYTTNKFLIKQDLIHSVNLNLCCMNTNNSPS